MALDVYLQSFLNGAPGGGDAMGALSLMRAFGAELDDFGAWQVDLGDGIAAEVTGLADLAEAQPNDIWALSALVRLSDLTPRGADFLFGLAQSGLMTVILPNQEAPGGAYVMLPMDVDPAHLPDEALFDAPEGIENSNEMYSVLEPLQVGHWTVQDDELTATPQPRQGVIARFLDWLRG